MTSARISFHFSKDCSVKLSKETPSRDNNNALCLSFDSWENKNYQGTSGVTWFGLDDATADALAAVTQLNEEGRAVLVKYANGLLSQHGDEYANNY